MKKKKENLSLFTICQKCGTRCCTEPGPPIVFPEETERIQNYCVEQGLKDHIEKVENKPYSTIPRGDGSCPYFKEGKCSIQEVKPLDCRVYPIGLPESLRVSISVSCPAKHLLSQAYKQEATKELQTLSLQHQKEFAEFAAQQRYIFTARPSPYAIQQLLDCYDCDSLILASNRVEAQYEHELIARINLPIQNTEAFSISTRVVPSMLETHIDIFSRSQFDTKETAQFTKMFFKAQKIRNRVLQR